MPAIPAGAGARGPPPAAAPRLRGRCASRGASPRQALPLPKLGSQGELPLARSTAAQPRPGPADPRGCLTSAGAREMRRSSLRRAALTEPPPPGERRAALLPERLLPAALHPAVLRLAVPCCPPLQQDGRRRLNVLSHAGLAPPESCCCCRLPPPASSSSSFACAPPAATPPPPPGSPAAPGGAGAGQRSVEQVAAAESLGQGTPRTGLRRAWTAASGPSRQLRSEMGSPGCSEVPPLSPLTVTPTLAQVSPAAA